MRRKEILFSIVVGLAGAAGVAAARPAVSPAKPIAPGLPLPQVRLSGPIQVSLVRFQSGLSPADLRSPAALGQRAWLRADFRVEQKGAVTRAWLPERLRLQDAAGHRWSVEGTRVFYGPDGEGVFAFPQASGSHPFPWRMTVELARATRFMPYEFWGSFSRDELWTLPLIPVPRPGQTRESPASDRTARRQGARLELAEAIGPRVPLRGARATAGVTRLAVRMADASDGTELTLLRATDFKGRWVPLVARSEVRHPRDREDVFGLQTRPDARTLNVTFAVHRMRMVQFTVSPTPPVPKSDEFEIAN